MKMKIIILIFVTLLLNNSIYAAEITLHIPILAENKLQHQYFHELLKTALEEDGHKVELITETLPQKRIYSYLDEGHISIYWLLKSEYRDSQYIPVDVSLTDGLIGKRILFIRKEDQEVYSSIKNLEDFRNLNSLGYLGNGWFDVKVWKENKLRYYEISGNWQKIFSMVLHGREQNYFPRGLNEIITESKTYPELAIEKNLVLIYDRDFCFYLSKTGKNAGAKYSDIITKSLKKASRNGLIDKLVQKYWGNDLKELNYSKRTKIYLKTPE